MRVGLGLLLGGAVGNLIDRVARGSVTDFIDVGFLPVGNLADSSLGLGLLAYFFLFSTPTGQKPASPDTTD